jgi:hypothetical protein
LKFSGKLPKTRGLFARWACLLHCVTKAPAWRLPEDHDATTCSPPPAFCRREGSPRGPIAMPRHSPSFLSSFPGSLLLFLSVLAHSSRSSSPSPAVPHCHLVLREAEKIPIAVLFFPARGIDRNRPESPPIHRISLQISSSSAAKFRPVSGQADHAKGPRGPRPSSFSAPERRLHGHLQEPTMAGLFWPSWPGWPAYMALGPPSQPLWVKRPRVQKVMRRFLFSRKTAAMV